MKVGERFLATSEPIESFFGKFKALEGEQKAFGFTNLILASLAVVGPLEKSLVYSAMKTVKNSDIVNWQRNEIGKTIQQQRRLFRRKFKRALFIVGAESVRILPRKSA